MRRVGLLLLAISVLAACTNASRYSLSIRPGNSSRQSADQHIAAIVRTICLDNGLHERRPNLSAVRAPRRLLCEFRGETTEWVVLVPMRTIMVSVVREADGTLTVACNDDSNEGAYKTSRIRRELHAGLVKELGAAAVRNSTFRYFDFT